MSFEKFLVDGGGCFKDYCVKAKGRHQKKTKNCRFGENGTIGGEGSEKLLNFHHLQMMKNMEGGGLRVTFHYFIEPNYD